MNTLLGEPGPVEEGRDGEIGPVQLLEAVIRHLPVGVAMVRGADLTLQLANPAFQSLAPGRQLVGRTVEEVWPGAQSLLAERCRRVLRTGEPFHATDETLGLDCPDVSRPARPCFMWSMSRIPGPGGCGPSLLITAWETTGRDWTEEQLARRMEEQQVIFDAAPVGINIAEDPACTIIRGNRVLADLLGMDEVTNVSKSGPEADRLPFSVLSDGRELEPHELPMQRAAAEGRAVTDQLLDFVREDGSRVSVLVNARPLRDGRGEVRGAVGICVDITRLREDERALRDGERRLAEELADMTRLHEVSTRMARAGDATALLLDIVDAAIALTGADMGDIRLLDSLTGRLRIVASRGLDAPFLDFFDADQEGRAACGMALRDGERVCIEDVSNDPDLVGTPALGVLLAAGIRAVHSTPLVSRSGGLVGMLSMHHRSPRRPTDRDLRLIDLLARQAADFLERHRAEQALRASEELTHELVEQCPFGVYIVDDGLRIATMNRGSRDGAFANVRPVIGRPLDEAMRVLWPEPVAAEIVRTFRHTLETGDPYRSKDFVNPRADERRVEGYEWELHRVTMPDGRPGVACYYYDSTKLRSAEAALREADRRKDEFLAMLAHELRNPLAAVGNAASLLGISDEPEAGTWAREVIERQTRQLARLLDDLMDVARISRGKLRLRRERLDAVPIIRRAVETSRAAMDAKGHDLATAVTGRPAWVEADPARLEQMVLNLLLNAAKYTDPGGRITLEARAEAGWLLVTIGDNGVGISPEMLSRIFEPFAQVDATLDRTQGGLGIGLSLVKTLAEMHGGRVTAASGGLGAGSEFVLRLPLAGPAPDAEGLAAPGRVGSGGLRILAVDDNKDHVSGLARILEHVGHRVLTASDGRSALDVAREFHPDVILLDIGLPEMDGYQVASRLRDDPTLMATSLVAVTGYGQEQDRERSRLAGFDHHLVKPVDLDTLMGVFDEVRAHRPPF